MDPRSWIEIGVAITIPLGVALVMLQRIWSNKSLTARSIQFVAVVMLVPAIIVLAMEKVLEGATVGTLIGGLTGYLLSGISNYDRPGGT